MAVTDDGVDFRQSGQFVGSALGVAAGDDDASGGVLAADAAEVRAGLAVGFRGDTAGIYNDDIGGRGLAGRRESVVAQVGGNGLAVGAAGAAAEVFNVIFCHVAQCINGEGGRWRSAPAASPSLKLLSLCFVYDPAVGPRSFYEETHSFGR